MSDLDEKNARAQKQALLNFQMQMVEYDKKFANQDLQIAQLRARVDKLEEKATSALVKNFSGGATT